jgi:hypothetical protein
MWLYRGMTSSTSFADEYGIAGEPLYDQDGVQFGTGIMAYETVSVLEHTLIDLIYKDSDGYRQILTDVPAYMVGTMTVGGRSAWTFATQCCGRCSGRAIIFAGWVEKSGRRIERVEGRELVDGEYPLVGL